MIDLDNDAIYTQRDLDEEREAVIDEVLEIIDDRILFINNTIPGRDLEQELILIRPKVEALKGGE